MPFAKGGDFLRKDLRRLLAQPLGPFGEVERTAA